MLQAVSFPRQLSTRGAHKVVFTSRLEGMFSVACVRSTVCSMEDKRDAVLVQALVYQSC